MCKISWLVVLIICDVLINWNLLVRNFDYTYAQETRFKKPYFLSRSYESSVEFGLSPFEHGVCKS